MHFFTTFSPYLTGILFGLWLLFYLWGKRQFEQARKLTLDLVLEEVKEVQKDNAGLTVDQYYEHLMPKWETLIQEKIKFIPHKSEFWPMPAKPAYVRTRLNLTPVWLGAFLKLNGVILQATEMQQTRIDEIVSVSQKIAQ